MSESDRQRQQREQAAKILRQAMPDINHMVGEIVRAHPAITNMNKLFGDQYQGFLREIQRNVALQMPKIDVAKLGIQVPALKLDYTALFPDFAGVQKKHFESMRPAIETIEALQRSQFADVIKNFNAIAQAGLPPNWRDDDIDFPTDLGKFLLDEGLALAWVPPASIVKRLFAATSPQEGRRILGARWKTIATACIAELKAVDHPALAEYVEFALDAAQTLAGSSHRAAQALSASLLDTLLQRNFNTTDRVTITGQKTRMNIEDYPVRLAIVLGGIWGSYGEFWISNGDKIPRRYSRHGSAHGVSRRQYSRINSLLALMHVVSLIKLLERTWPNRT